MRLRCSRLSVEPTQCARECRDIIIEEVHLRDVKRREEKRENLHFWWVFAELYLETSVEYVGSSELLRNNQEILDIAAIEACMVYKGIELYLDTSYSIHVIWELEDATAYRNSPFSKENMLNICRDLECMDIYDNIKYWP